MLRWFARQLLEFAKTESGALVEFPLTAIRIGKDFGIVSLPGEPFAEIGMAIKQGSPCDKTFVVSLANGQCGYVPLQECYARGGYEQLIVTMGGGSTDMAATMVEYGHKALSQ